MPSATDDAPAFVVIHPGNTVTYEFMPLSAQAEVDALIAAGMDRASIALRTEDDARLPECELRIWANDVMLLMPDKFSMNNAAHHLIQTMSGGRITQPWRGVVAIVEYDRDPATGEVGFPAVMSEERREFIKRFLDSL